MRVGRVERWRVWRGRAARAGDVEPRRGVGERERWRAVRRRAAKARTLGRPSVHGQAHGCSLRTHCDLHSQRVSCLAWPVAMRGWGGRSGAPKVVQRRARDGRGCSGAEQERLEGTRGGTGAGAVVRSAEARARLPASARSTRPPRASSRVFTDPLAPNSGSSPAQGVHARYITVSVPPRRPPQVPRHYPLVILVADARTLLLARRLRRPPCAPALPPSVKSDHLLFCSPRRRGSTCRRAAEPYSLRAARGRRPTPRRRAAQVPCAPLAIVSKSRAPGLEEEALLELHAVSRSSCGRARG